MKSFLEQVVEDVLGTTTDLSNATFVFPGRRPMAFFKKTMVEKGFQGILPKLQSIEGFLGEIAQLKSVNSIPLLFESYKAYREVVDEPESFEDFIKWAPTLLKDFDDMDSSLADEKYLFEYLISAERIRNWGVNDLEIGLSDLMQKHLGFWSNAAKLYMQLNVNLTKNKMAYPGQIAKKAYELAPEYFEHKQGEIYFIGFNAFTKAEQYIVEYLVSENKAKIYWDADEYYLNDPKQEAGEFLRKYQKRKAFKSSFKFINSDFVQPKQFKTIGVPQQVGMAKYTGQLLQEMPFEEREKTAIVLADENILPAMLNALPQSVEKINITMGLPLSMVPMGDFFSEWISLYMQREKVGNSNSFYYKNIINLLEDGRFGAFFLPQKTDLLKKIKEQNLIFISENIIQDNLGGNDFSTVFSSPKSCREFPKQVVNWIELVHEKDELSDMDAEYLFRFKALFEQLNQWMQVYPWVESYKTLYQLYQQLIQKETVSFLGEPLVGLQLLGMLETRLLDFENVILCSVNEGVLPLGRQENTFIPFDIRKEAGLNTFKENDAIYAYHFYRLIQRTKSATFLYNTETEGIVSGEPSRFLRQLEWESPHKVNNVMAAPAFSKPSNDSIEIAKDDNVMQKLHRYFKKGISTSSLQLYVRDPIAYYQRYILGLKEDVEVEEVAGAMTLGQVVHDSLDELYTPYLNEILTVQHFAQLEKKVSAVVHHHFEQKYLKGGTISGKNLVIEQVANALVLNVVKKDGALIKSGNELIIQLIEKELAGPYTMQNGETIQFKGIIDRVDKLNGDLRILDYKTGSFNVKDYEWSEDKMDELITKPNKAKSIQLALYAYLYLNEYGTKSVKSGIYPLRYFGKNIAFLTFDKEDELTPPIVQYFMNEIEKLIQEILNPNIPFREPED